MTLNCFTKNINNEHAYSKYFLYELALIKILTAICKDIKCKYLSDERIFFKTTGPQYNKKNLNSVAFQRATSFKDRVFLTKSGGTQDFISMR